MKIAIYYMHYEALGHTTRIKNIFNLIDRKDVEVLVIQDGKSQDFLNYNFKVKNFPFPSAGREMFHGKRMDLSIPIIKKRLQFLKKELKEFMPDVFITEFFPFGRKLFSIEMAALLESLKEINPNVKIYASIGYPYLENDKVLKFAKYYDKILIHCPKNLDFEYVKKAAMNINEEGIIYFYNKVFTALKDKIVYTNYITNKKKPLEKEKVRREFNIKKNQKLILVSRGGGVTDMGVITSAIKSAEMLGAKFFFVIVYGPSSTLEEEEIFYNMAKGKTNIKLIRFRENFLDLLNACDVSVSMAGYNTSLETLWLGKKAILIPRSIRKGSKEPGYARFEQYYRAIMLENEIKSKVILPKELNPEILAELIRDKVKENNRIIANQKWFDSEGIIRREILFNP